MKKLFLILPLLAAAAFAWLGMSELPAPTAEVETTLPASQILGK